jgi:cellulose synthase/poly-beta-1,6-N-acetylglucosamine synthase-like glycosyltransferase
MPTVSVAICSFATERWEELRSAVTSVAAQTRRADEIVVVVDHNDELLERSRVEWGDLQVVANRGMPGLSSARNTGVEVSSSDIVAFLDDDAEAAPDWLQILVDRYRDPDVVAVGGAVVPRWVSGRPGWFPPEFDWVVGCTHSGMPAEAKPVRNLVGANMSFRRELLVGLGGFTTDLGRVGDRPVGCEETELCIRTHQKSPDLVVLYDPRARVDHLVPSQRATMRYFLARCAAEGRSKAVLGRMVGGRAATVEESIYARAVLPAGIRRALASAWHGDPRGVLRAAVIVLGLLTTSTAYLKASLSSGRRTGARASVAAL